MSQSTLSVEIHIKDETIRRHFVEKLDENEDSIALKNDEIYLEQVFIDDVISIEGITGQYTDNETEIRNWLKSIKADVCAVHISNDYDTCTFGLVDGKKVPYKKAIDALTKISKRVEAAYKIESSESKSLVAFLKKNQIRATDKYQGVSHIDRCVEEERYPAIDYFIEAGLAPNHNVLKYRSVGKVRQMLAFELMHEEGFYLVKKLIEKGLDINVKNEDGYGLLHYVDEDNIDMCKYLIDKGCAINEPNSFGKTPVMSIIKRFFARNKAEELESETGLYDQFMDTIKLFSRAGAQFDLFDNNGAGNLLYARHNNRFRAWLLEINPGLSEHANGTTRDIALSSLIKGRAYSLKFYDNCLKEGLTSPFFQDDFLNALSHISAKKPVDMKKTAILFASQFVELFCRYDNVNLIRRLESLGFPLLMPCYGKTGPLTPSYTGGNSYVYAQNCKSQHILSYMEQNGINNASLERIENNLSDWLTKSINASVDMTYIIENTSEKWRASILQKWQQMNEKESTRKVGLEVFTKNCFASVFKHSSTIHMNHIWGENLF